MHAYVYRYYAVYIVFIGGRGYAKGILVDLNVPNIYVKDIVAVFKLLLRLTPQ